MMLLDRLLEPFPWLKSFLEYADQYMGPVIGVTLFLLILLVFYWTFILVPKRVHRLLKGLSKKGYAEIDPADPRLSKVIERLAPIYDHHPRKNHPIPPWKVVKAVSSSRRGGTRYLIYASRTQVEWSGSGPGNTNHLRYCVMVLEKRALPFPEPVCLKPTRNPGKQECDPRDDLQKVMPEKSSPFFAQYALFTRSGAMVTIPDDLQAILTSLLPLFILQDSPSAHIWGVNLKFSKEGWGMLSSEEIYKPEPMDRFLEAADRISESLI
jgi:hypothetical protein